MKFFHTFVQKFYSRQISIGVEKLNTSQFNEAIKAFEFAFPVTKENVFEKHYLLGQAHFCAKNIDQATDHLKIAVDSNPFKGDALYRYGVALFTKNLFDEAKDIFSLANEKNIVFEEFKFSDFEKYINIIIGIQKSRKKMMPI